MLSQPSGTVSSYAPEAEVAHAGVDHLRPARRRPVAQAVAVGAQVRAALDHLAADRGTAAGPGRSSARGPRRAGCSGRSRASRRRRGARLVHQSSVHSQTLPAMSKRPKPLGGKLPTGAVRRKPLSPVLRQGKSGPSQVLAMIRAARPGLVAPGVRRARRARRGRRTPTRPRSAGAAPAQRAYASASSWATCTTGWSSRRFDRARRALAGAASTRRASSVHHWLRWRRSTGPRVGVNTIEPGLQVLRRGVRVVGRVQGALGHGDVAGGRDERRELGVGHRVGVDGERRRPAPRWVGASSG